MKSDRNAMRRSAGIAIALVAILSLCIVYILHSRPTFRVVGKSTVTSDRETLDNRSETAVGAIQGYSIEPAVGASAVVLGAVTPSVAGPGTMVSCTGSGFRSGSEVILSRRSQAESKVECIIDNDKQLHFYVPTNFISGADSVQIQLKGERSNTLALRVRNDFGLTGEYYSFFEQSIQGFPETEGRAPDLVRNDSRIQFYGSSFNVPFHQDNFAVRWSGEVNILEAGIYTMFTYSDDGSALYIDDNLIVDNRGEHGPKEELGSVHLDPGFHAIRVEYFNSKALRMCRAAYQRPGDVEKSTIPAWVLFRSELQGGDAAQDACKATFIPSKVWPGEEISLQVEAQGVEQITRVVFKGKSDAEILGQQERGCRLRVPSDARSGTVEISLGEKACYAEIEILEVAGFIGEYYKVSKEDARQFNFPSGKPDLVRIDKQIEFLASSTWGEIGDGERKVWLPFSTPFECTNMLVRWTGVVLVEAPEEYVTTLCADDGARYFVDDDLIVDNGGPHAFECKSRIHQMNPGKHVIRVEYSQGEGYALVQMNSLRHSTEGLSKTQAKVFPPAEALNSVPSLRGFEESILSGPVGELDVGNIVYIGEIIPGDVIERRIEIRNVGGQDLRIDGYRATSGVDVLFDNSIVPPGKRSQIAVRLLADSADVRDKFVMHLLTNDIINSIKQVVFIGDFRGLIEASPPKVKFIVTPGLPIEPMNVVLRVPNLVEAEIESMNAEGLSFQVLEQQPRRASVNIVPTVFSDGFSTALEVLISNGGKQIPIKVPVAVEVNEKLICLEGDLSIVGLSHLSSDAVGLTRTLVAPRAFSITKLTLTKKNGDECGIGVEPNEVSPGHWRVRIKPLADQAASSVEVPGEYRAQIETNWLSPQTGAAEVIGWKILIVDDQKPRND